MQGAIVNGITERMRLTADGKLGVGTSSPGYKLHVVGDINFTGSLYQNVSINKVKYTSNPFLTQEREGQRKTFFAVC